MSDPEPALDLGHNHSIQYVEHSRMCEANNPGPAGLIDRHLKPDGSPCGYGFGSFVGLCPGCNTKPATWDFTGTREKPTLSPSLLCTVCGDHGFIRDGRWVPA